MSSTLPSQARVVIIGGGVIGTAAAYRLTTLGCADILVLERNELGCGTSWHAAGNIPMMDRSPVHVEFNKSAAALYSDLETEQSIGWRQSGRVMLARTEARLNDYRLLIETAARMGVEAELLDPGGVADKLPLFRTDDLVGGLWSPEDGRLNPTDLIGAYTRKARAAGAQIVEGVTVQRTVTEGGRVTGVEYDGGRVACEVVINCAGLWARALGLENDIAIPVYPVEHFYALTEVVSGVTPDMPTFRDPDGLIYGREEVGGLLIGCFDRDAKTFSPDVLPASFSFDLLNEDWEQFGPYMEQGIHRIPVLEHTGIRTLLNGPECFTPDGQPILDRALGLDGYYVAAGMSSAGILRSAGMAESLAHWIVDGDPGRDLSAFTLRRFSPEQNDEAWLREHIRHIPSGYLSSTH